LNIVSATNKGRPMGGLEAVDNVGSPENQEQIAALPRR